jgi:hypothetical protein
MEKAPVGLNNDAASTVCVSYSDLKQPDGNVVMMQQIIFGGSH